MHISNTGVSEMKISDKTDEKTSTRNWNKLYIRTSNPFVLNIFIIIILLTVWGTGIIFSLFQYNLTIRTAQDELYRMNQVVAEQTGNLFREIRSYLLVLDEWMKDNPHSDPRTDPEFINLVATIKKSSRIQFNIRLVSKDNGLFYIPSTDIRKPLALVGDREYVKAQKDPATRGFYIARPVLSRVTSIWVIPVSYPITRNNAGMAVIIAAIELPTLNKLYETIRPKPNGGITLATIDGIILDRVPFDAESMGLPIGGEMNHRDIPDGIQTIVSPIGNVEKIISFQKIQDMPLRVSISIPKDEVLSSWRYRMIIFFSLLSLMSILIILFGFFLYKSWLKIIKSEKNLKKLNGNLQEKNLELEVALSRVKQLSGMLPICASCKKIRNDTGYWEQIEHYIGTHSQAEFSHGICPDCAGKLYPGIYSANKKSS
jgi:hypothetical protein